MTYILGKPMEKSLDPVTIKGFKSIQSLEDFKLTNLNILIIFNE